jgi:hydrogenase-4 membrane subunit HyfE
MSTLLVVFLLVILLPLFISTWRTSLLGLSAQGLLMGWIAHQAEPALSAASVSMLVDLVIVRGVVAPLLLHRILRAAAAPRRNDVIPPNLLSWGLVGILVALGFHFASRVVPAEAQLQTHVAVACTALLLGLFVLATQTGVFSQVVGALRIENAIALFELGGAKPVTPLPVQIGQLVVFVVTVLLYAFYVQRLPASTAESAEPPPRPEGPAL